VKELWRLPSSWRWSDFRSIASVEADLVDPSDHCDAPHIAPNHIESWTGRLLPFSTIAGDGVTSPKHRFRPGQILYSKIRPYLAKAVIARFDGLCSADMYPIDADIHSGFLHRWMLTPAFTELAAQRQGRTVLPKINREALSELPVPVGPFSEQRRIVAKIEELFSHLDAGVAALERVEANLKRYRASVLKAAVEGKLTEHWRDENPPTETGDELLQRIQVERRKRWEEGQIAQFEAKGKTPPKDWKEKYREPVAPDTSGLPELPAGWCWGSLEAITDPVRVICYGILMPKEHVPDGILYVKVRDMRLDQIDVATLQRTSPRIAAKYARASLKRGDILLSIRGTYGRVAAVPIELDGGNITQDTARLAVHSAINREYVAVFLRSSLAQNYFKRVARGVAVKGVNIAEVRTCPVAIPPQSEQTRIVAVSEQASAPTQLLSGLLKGQKSASHLRQSILSRAFSGRLVAQDPTDEPASVLLDRIRAARAEGAKPKPKSRKRLQRS
jgi:type I restriction enzyme S subunit